jgi:hypothetical protein
MKLVATSPIAALRIRGSLVKAGFEATVEGASVPREVHVSCGRRDESEVLAIARAADKGCRPAPGG